MRIAVIPARGGSKRIPRKNVRTFSGKPMIVHVIETALHSGCFHRVLVSTDDDEIASVSISAGAEVPFRRPAMLSDDYTPIVPVIAHAIEACELADSTQFSYVCCLYPCAPFIHVEDLAAGLELLQASDAAYCIAVAEFPASVQRALRRNENGRMSPFFPGFELSRTQDLECGYYDAGQFCWGRADSWLSKVTVHSNCVGLPVSNCRVVDIDTEGDWVRAEMMSKMFNLRENHE